MARRRLGIIAFLICLCLCSGPCHAFGASTADARGPISLDRTCTITINYGYDGVPFEDVTVALYKIATVSSDAQYSLTENFRVSGLVLNGVQTNGEWNVIRSTLEANIVANNIEPEAVMATNQRGQVTYEGLEPGLYLAIAGQAVQEDVTCVFASALVALPDIDEEGYWHYEVEVTAKAEVLPPVDPDEELELKVIKLWKGETDQGKRPNSVEVEVFRDGVSYDKITLSAEKNWSYSWIVPDDGAKWIVVERNVPEGYTATIEEKGTSFVLTNTLVADKPPVEPPKTGDTANIWLYIILLYVSGIVLVLMGIMGRKRKNS